MSFLHWGGGGGGVMDFNFQGGRDDVLYLHERSVSKGAWHSS